jgi:hypothetical protein
VDINSPTCRKIVFHIQRILKQFGLGFKNEPNLDFENRDKDNVLNWLNHMVSVIKNSILTIWSLLVGLFMEATRLADKVDFVLPFYNAIEDFEKENTILEKL